MKKNLFPTIMLIPPQLLPIPAIGGGGIETLITNIIDVNEIEKKVLFIIPSQYREGVSKFNYKYTRIYYFDENNSNDHIESKASFKLLKYKYFILTFFEKLAFNRFTYRIFRKASIEYPNSFLLKCLYLCKREKVDFIVNESCLIKTDYFGLMSKYIGKSNIFFRIHNSVPVGSLKERKIIPNSIALSKYGRDKWVSAYNIKGNNYVVYSGINMSLFDKDYSLDEKNDLKSKLGINNKEKVILYCGRIDPIKGVDELLRAFTSINDKRIRLVMIGGVAYSQNIVSPFLNKVREVVEQDNRIIYVGYVKNNELYRYYNIADLQIVPTICEEAAGLVCVEGMACGLPLIVTQSGGMVEYIDDKCAIILPRDDNLVTNLKKSIVSIINDDEKLKSMSIYSKERSRLFTAQNHYDNFIKIFIENK